MLGTGGSQFPVKIMLKKKAVVAGVDESEHDGSLDEDSGSNGYDEENMGTPGKMFVN